MLKSIIQEASKKEDLAERKGNFIKNIADLILVLTVNHLTC